MKKTGVLKTFVSVAFSFVLLPWILLTYIVRTSVLMCGVKVLGRLPLGIEDLHHRIGCVCFSNRLDESILVWGAILNIPLLLLSIILLWNAEYVSKKPLYLLIGVLLVEIAIRFSFAFSFIMFD